MKVIIFGGSGFIGKHLIPYFSKQGYEVVIVSRFRQQTHLPRVRSVTWDDLQENLEVLEEADVFINLAGEPINQYWTPKTKEKILDSRMGITKRIAQYIKKLEHKPKVVLNGSAIGIYGMSETAVFDEACPSSNDDFLSHVVYEWEKAAELMDPYTRLVKVRIGVVIGTEGGALPKMALPYRLFIGGKVGTGKQWLSWIHINDLIRLLDFCIHNEEIKGPINATAPNPVTNNEFGQTVSKVLNRPHVFSVPSFSLKVMFGEMSQMLLNGQKVLPTKALQHGFSFTYPTLQEALEDLLG